MDMNEQQYRAHSAVNISTLKELWKRSALHYRHRLIHQTTTTPAMALGTAVHMAVLEPERFAEHYTIRPADVDGRTKAGKEWLVAHAGENILTAAQCETCYAMSIAVRGHDVAARWLTDGEPEVVLLWTDEETDTKCKGRADWITVGNALVGLKTGNDVTDERTFQRQAANLGYHLQWAYYHDAMVALGRTPTAVVEIAVDSDDVHDVCCWEIDDETLDAGREAYRSALVTLKECCESDVWPGRAPGQRLFRLPAYALPQDHDDLADLDFGGVAA